MISDYDFKQISVEIISHGSLAQLGEHLPYKQRVTGSSPVTSTTKKDAKRRLFCLLQCLHGFR